MCVCLYVYKYLRVFVLYFSKKKTKVQKCLRSELPWTRFIGGSYVTQPANGTCGGLTCSNENYSIMQVDVRRFSVTVQVKQRKGNAERGSLTGVYGPQSDNDRMEFLQELRQLFKRSGCYWVTSTLSIGLVTRAALE
jgi:hypothetical protein